MADIHIGGSKTIYDERWTISRRISKYIGDP
jgi:hypothetical protein